MTASDPIDAARLNLLLNELRLPVLDGSGHQAPLVQLH